MKTAKAKIILEGNELLGRGVATYCFDTEATRDRFVLALENLAQGREWHEDSTSSSRGRLGASSTSSCSSVDGSGDGGSGGGGGRSSGGGGGGGVGVLCALPMAQVMADYCELMDVYKAFVSGKIVCICDILKHSLIKISKLDRCKHTCGDACAAEV